jgi:hypothetical protein
VVGCADEVYQELEEVEEDGVVLVLEDCATFDDCADALEDFPPPEPVEPSNTTKFAFPPLGTVTTQKAPPPAPLEEPPTISLTPFLEGSIAQGRPLQPSVSQTISTPQVGMSLRKGVAGSR